MNKTSDLDQFEELDESFLNGISAGSTGNSATKTDKEDDTIDSSVFMPDLEIPADSGTDSQASTSELEVKASASSSTLHTEEEDLGNGVTQKLSFGAMALAEAHAGPLGASAGVGARAETSLTYEFGNGLYAKEYVAAQAGAGTSIGLQDNSLTAVIGAEAASMMGLSTGASDVSLGNGFTSDTEAHTEVGLKADVSYGGQIGLENTEIKSGYSLGNFISVGASQSIGSELGSVTMGGELIAPGSVSQNVTGSLGFDDGAVNFGLNGDVAFLIGGASLSLDVSVQLFDTYEKRGSPEEIQAAMEEISVWKQDYDAAMTDKYDEVLKDQHLTAEQGIQGVPDKIDALKEEQQQCLEDARNSSLLFQQYAGLISVYEANGYTDYANYCRPLMENAQAEMEKNNDRFREIDDEIEVQTELLSLHQEYMKEVEVELDETDQAQLARVAEIQVEQYENKLATINQDVQIAESKIEKANERIGFYNDILSRLENGSISADALVDNYTSQHTTITQYESDLSVAKAAFETQSDADSKAEIDRLLGIDGGHALSPQELLNQNSELKDRIDLLNKNLTTRTDGTVDYWTEKNEDKWRSSGQSFSSDSVIDTHESSYEDVDSQWYTRERLIIDDDQPARVSGIIAKDGLVEDGSLYDLETPTGLDPALEIVGNEIFTNINADLSGEALKEKIVTLINSQVETIEKDLVSKEAELDKAEDDRSKHADEIKRLEYWSKEIGDDIEAGKEYGYADSVENARELGKEVGNELQELKDERLQKVIEIHATEFLASKLDSGNDDKVSADEILETVSKEVSSLETEIEKLEDAFEDVIKTYKTEDGAADNIPENMVPVYNAAVAHQAYENGLIDRGSVPEIAMKLIDRQEILETLKNGDFVASFMGYEGENADNFNSEITMGYQHLMEGHKSDLKEELSELNASDHLSDDDIAHLDEMLADSLKEMQENNNSFGATKLIKDVLYDFEHEQKYSEEEVHYIVANVMNEVVSDQNINTKELMDLVDMNNMPSFASHILNDISKHDEEMQQFAPLTVEKLSDLMKDQIESVKGFDEKIEETDDRLRDILKEDPMLRGEMMMAEQIDKIDDLKREFQEKTADLDLNDRDDDKEYRELKHSYEVKIAAVEKFVEHYQSTWTEGKEKLDNENKLHGEVLAYRMRDDSYLDEMVKKSGFLSSIGGWFS